jgi:hypothetical protein
MNGTSRAAKHRLRLPFNVQVVYGSRKFFSGLAFALAALSLFGPVVPRTADHNAYRYVVGALVCPMIGLALHLLIRFNPYRWNGPANRALNYLDERDEDARRLVEIIGSSGYPPAALKAAVWLAVPLLAVMSVCAVLVRDTLSWSPVSPGLLYGAVGGVLFSWMFIRIQIVSWALTTWWGQYGDLKRPPERG